MQVSGEHKLLGPTQVQGLELLLSLAGKRATIIGVGQRLRADDGFGPMVCSNIAGLVDAEVIDAGPVPENFIGPVLRSRPENLIIIDAVEMGLRPGSIAAMNLERVRSIWITTHCCSLGLFVGLIGNAIEGKAVLLGVQPACLAFGGPISPEVTQAVEYVSRILIHIFGPRLIKTPGPI